jgi:hypothetical protein
VAFRRRKAPNFFKCRAKARRTLPQAVCVYWGLAKAGRFIGSGAATVVVLRCLTLELSGPQRHGAWPVRRTINQGVARAKRHAVAGPLERRVRPHSWALAVRAGRAACDGPAFLLPEPRDKLDPSNGLAAPYAARLHKLTNLSAMMRRRGLPTQLEVLRLL